MKKKKKGFTLTELIVVIVILAVLLLIGIPAYNSIRARILEKQYQNLVALIETEAEKFAGDTGTNITNVEELIQYGYLEADEDGEFIYDPRDNSIMNCFLVMIENNKGTYNAKLTNEESIKDGKCDLSSARDKYSTVNIIVRSAVDASMIYNDPDETWIGEKVTFVVDTTNMTDEDKISGIKWVTSTGAEANTQEYTPDITGLMTGRVTVHVSTTDGAIYSAFVNVKIDLQDPIIEDVEVSGGNDWTKGREVKVSATDQTGSGISGYYVGNKACDGNSEYVKDSTFYIPSEDLLTEDGNPVDYYICVMDNVGNVAEYDNVLKLSIKDKAAPTCKVTGENTDWTKENVTIKISCEDEGSGCNPQYSEYSKTYTTTTDTDEITYTIKDNAGNSTVCKETVNVYTDKDAPSVPTLTNPTGGDWTDSSFNVTATSSDVGSGIANWYWSYNNSTWNTAAATSLSNNKQTYISNYVAEGNRTAYIKVCDEVGNCSQNNTTIKIDKCESTTASYGSWSQCNKACGGGTKSRTVTYRGISSKTCSSSTQTERCNTQSCAPTVTISGNINNWSCNDCRNDQYTEYCALNSEGDCLNNSAGKSGNVMAKVSYTKSGNAVTFTITFVQGKHSTIGMNIWFVVKASDGTQILKQKIKSSSDGTWGGGTTHSATVRYTFNAKGTFYIWTDSDSANFKFDDINLGTITVS